MPGRLHRFAAFGIRARLSIAVGVLSLCCALLAALALTLAERQANTGAALYSDNIRPIRNLTGMLQDFVLDIVHVSHKVSHGIISAPEAQRAVADAMTRSEAHWTELTGPNGGLSPDVVRSLEASYGAAYSVGLDLKALIARGDVEAIETFTEEKLYPAIDDLSARSEAAILKLMADSEQRLVALERQRRENRLLVFASLAIAGAAVLFSLWLTRHKLARPLQAIARNIDRLAEGDDDFDIGRIEGHDEVSRMASSVATLRDRLREARLERARADLAAEEMEERQKRFRDELSRQFRGTVEAVADSVASAASRVTETAKVVSFAIREAETRAQEAVQQSQHSATQVHRVGLAAAHLQASIAETSDRAFHSAAMTEQTSFDTTRTDSVIARLVTSTERIGEVVAFIKGFSEQINLLALNATIEAARAGPAGRGFAIVAQEVKALANRTAEAAEDIAAQIAQVQDATGATTGAVAIVTKTMEDINGLATSISDAVARQQASVSEIATVAADVDTATRLMTEAVEAVLHETATTSAAAAESRTLAQMLDAEARRLKEEAQQFLATIAA
jgi:methyl-accepting chemotaxis protein